MKTVDLLNLLRRLQAIIRRRIELILIPLFILTPGGFIVYKLMPRTYRSYTKLLVAEPKTQQNLLVQVGSSAHVINNRINLLINVVMSQKVLAQLAQYIAQKKGLTLSKRELFEWVNGLRSQVSIWNVGQGLVLLEYKGRNPDECLDHLLYLYELFMKESLRPQQDAVRRSATFLSKQMERLQSQLQKSERALTDFKREYSLELPKTFQANLSNYHTLRKTLFQDQLEYAAAVRRRDYLRQQLDMLDPSLVQLRNQIIELLELKIKLVQYLGQYTERHPVVQRTRQRINNLQKQITNHQIKKLQTLKQLQKSVQNVRLSSTKAQKDSDRDDPRMQTFSVFDRYQETVLRLEVLTRQMAENKIQLAALKKQITDYPLREQQLGELQREAEVARTIYAKVRTLHEQTLLQRELDIYDASRQVQIIEPAQRPLYPIAPKFLFVVGGAIFAALALAGLLIALAEIVDPTLLDDEEVKQILGVEVIGEIKELPPIAL